MREALGYVRPDNGGTKFHGAGNFDAAILATRAGLVLSATGCDWREGGRCG